MRSTNSDNSVWCVQMHEEVSAALNSMGVAHRVNVSSADHLLRVDISVGSDTTAVEIVSPAQLTVNEPMRALGTTQLSWQMLMASGWRVRHCSYIVWHIRQV